MKKLLSLILTTALLLALFACGKPYQPLPNAPLVLGEKYLLDLDYEQAVLQFDEAIVIDPKNPRGYLGKADALLHLDRQADAVTTLQNGAKAVVKEQRAALKEAAVAVEKSPVDGFIGLSVAYILLGFREIALALLKRVCEELPEESRLKAVLEDLQSIIAKESAVPDLINKTLDEAKALLDAAGIAYEVKYETGNGTGNAVVINQEVKSVVLIVGDGSESQEISVSSTTTSATSTTENTTVPTTVKNTTENTTVVTTQKTTQKTTTKPTTTTKAPTTTKKPTTTQRTKRMGNTHTGYIDVPADWVTSSFGNSKTLYGMLAHPDDAGWDWYANNVTCIELRYEPNNYSGMSVDWDAILSSDSSTASYRRIINGMPMYCYSGVSAVVPRGSEGELTIDFRHMDISEAEFEKMLYSFSWNS